MSNSEKTDLDRDEFIGLALKLRSALDDAERALMKHLYWGEKTGIHNGTGRTFDEFIVANNIIRSERYRGWVAGFEALGDVAEEIGTNGVITAGKLKTSAERAAFVQEVKRSEETNDTRVSEQTARVIYDKVRIRFRSDKHESYEAVREDRDRLKEKVNSLMYENGTLKAENKRLKTELRSKAKAEA